MLNFFRVWVSRPSHLLKSLLLLIIFFSYAWSGQATTCTELYKGAGLPNFEEIDKCHEALRQEQGDCHRMMMDRGTSTTRCDALLSQDQPGWEEGFSTSGLVEDKSSQESPPIYSPKSLPQVKVERAPAGIDSSNWPGSEAQVTAEVKACTDSKEVADTCCGDPVQCMDEDSEFSLGNMQLITSMTMAGNTLAGGSIAEQCSRAKKLNQFGSLANSAMAVTCQTQKTSCEDACGKSLQKYKALLDECKQGTPLLNPMQRSQCNRFFQAYNTLNRTNKSCEGLAGQVSTMGVQAVSQVQAARMNELCEEQAKASANAPTFVDNGPAQPDCADPANASNPFCQNCSGPEAANNPACQPSAQNQGTPHGSVAQTYGGTAQFGQNSTFGSTSSDEETYQQSASFDTPVDTINKTTGIRKGNGGGAPQVGSAGSGLSANSGSKRHGKSRYKTDTLRGLNGYGGASVSSMGFQISPGSRGPASVDSKTFQTAKRLKKFNLKNYVPKIHKTLLERAPAGSITKEVASRHSKNLFQKVSDLFYRKCKTGEFFDCKEVAKQRITLPQVNGSTHLNAGPKRSIASISMVSKKKQKCRKQYVKRYCKGQYDSANCKEIKAKLYCDSLTKRR